MVKTKMEGSGFQVFHNSKEWRIAVHSYEEEVNGLSSFRQWGSHLTSEEAFVLMEGRAWLATSREGNEDDDFEIHRLEKGTLFLVEQAEKHAILTDVGASVLIIENRDMSESVNTPMPEGVIRSVKDAWLNEQ